MSTPLPPSGTAFGDRVRRKLDRDPIAWLTTVARDGTPQPNPVWFIPDIDGEGVLTYNRATAARVRHVRERPRVALHFNMREHDGDVAVLVGMAEIVDDAPPADANPAYQAKYRDRIRSLGMDAGAFAEAYPVAIRVRFSKARGL